MTKTTIKTILSYLLLALVAAIVIIPIGLLLIAAITQPEWVRSQFWLGGYQW